MVAARAPGGVELLDRTAELGEGGVVGEVARHEPEPLGQLLPDLLPELGAGVLLDRVVHDLGEVLVGPVPPGEADQGEARRQQAAVRQVVARLKQAIEQKDLALYKRLRPDLTAEEERRLKDAFQNVTSQQVEYAIESVSVEGGRATLRVTRTGRVSGQAVPAVRQVLKLAKTDGAWVITEIGQ